MPHFYTPCKRTKTRGFLTFSGGIEKHWTKMGQGLGQIDTNMSNAHSTRSASTLNVKLSYLKRCITKRIIVKKTMFFSLKKVFKMLGQ